MGIFQEHKKKQRPGLGGGDQAAMGGNLYYSKVEANFGAHHFLAVNS